MQKKLEIDIHPKNVNEKAWIKAIVAADLGIEIERITDVDVLKRSLDARRKDPLYHLSIDVYIDETPNKKLKTQLEPKSVSEKDPVFIIGMGPAGIFAAIELLLAGIKPVIIEMGNDVRNRRRDLAIINRNEGVNEQSNYCFGEGGAGTYSDGKLYTRSNKRGDVTKILETLVFFGADDSIMVDAHPHIGTNRLPKIIEAMRQWILENGGEIHFNTKLKNFEIEGNQLKSISLESINGTKQIGCNKLILATGHSGRNIYELFQTKNLLLEPKAFAMGVRVEHRQEIIDELQYHCNGSNLEEMRNHLPAASYSWVEQTGERAAYSFCMCPGGIIAPCATSNGEIVTNGWSPSKRNNLYANSGVITEVKDGDLKDFEKYGALKGLYYQMHLEQMAYRQVQKGVKAPAQRLIDFIESKPSATLPDCSYQPGVVSNEMNEWLPAGIKTALKNAFVQREKKMKGYLTNEAVIVGVESRSSSPVRIPRDKATLQHPQVKGIYPCGEGAGYAGGIVSAALDGVKVATATIGN